jgi:hypothetical protein
MKRLTQKEAFHLGFWGTLWVLGIANLIPYWECNGFHISPKTFPICDTEAVGFPFAFYSTLGWLPSQSEFFWLEASANLLFAVLGGLAVATALGRWSERVRRPIR